LEKFDRWDDNGDGQLTETELNHGINRFKGTPMKVDYTGKEVIDFYDTNKDGRVTLREAQAGYARSGEAEQIIKARN
jgi:Ca2+-binding EF-hand superfamily protein